MRRRGLLLFLLLATLPGLLACGDETSGPPDRVLDTPTTQAEGAVGDQLPEGELSPDLLPAIVATDDIRAGTSAAAALADGRLETRVIRRDLFPEDAVVTPELIELAEINQFVTGGTVMRITMFDPLPPAVPAE